MSVPVPVPPVVPEPVPEDSHCDAPACPPMYPGVGNDSHSVPDSAPSIADFQMSAGTAAPYMVPPHALSSGWLSSVPTHTAVAIDGV